MFIFFSRATVLPLRTTWIADSFHKRPCTMYKDNAHGWKYGSGDGQRLGLRHDWAIFHIPFPHCGSSLKGEVRRSPGPSARPSAAANSEELQSWRVYSWTALDCEKTMVLCFLPSWSTLLFERELQGKRGDLTRQPAVKHQSPAAKTTNSNSCDHAVAQVKQHIPEQRSESTEPISKKGIKLIPKTIGNRKGDLCVKLFEVANTTWENLQIAKHKSVQYAEWMILIMICALRFADFSDCVCHPEQLHAQSPFLFPTVWNLQCLSVWVAYVMVAPRII